MNYKDYILPASIGVLTLVFALVFLNKIKLILNFNNFSSEIFTFASLLFGLILTSYSILFGVLPSLNKSFRKSKTLQDINFYFISCLIMLLITIIASLIYLIIPLYWIFVILISLVGLDIGFFCYIIFLINQIFYLIIHGE